MAIERIVPAVAGHSGPAEAGDVGVVDRRERLADEVTGLAPAGAEDERDVVGLRPAALGDDRGRSAGDLERVGGGVGEVGGPGLTGCSARSRWQTTRRRGLRTRMVGWGP